MWYFYRFLSISINCLPISISSSEVWKRPKSIIRNVKSIFRYHPLRSQILQSLLSAMWNRYSGVIFWGLKTSKVYYLQCNIDIPVSTSEVWKPPKSIIRNVKSVSRYHLLTSENLQSLLFAMQNRYSGIIFWGLKASKVYNSHCEIDVPVSSSEVWKPLKSIIHNVTSIFRYHLLRS